MARAYFFPDNSPCSAFRTAVRLSSVRSRPMARVASALPWPISKALDALRGQRYNLEKQMHGGDRRIEEASRQNDDLKTSQRLADEYQVSQATIERDGQFAEGLDALKEVREDLPTSVLTKRMRGEPRAKGKGKGKPKVTKLGTS